MAVRGREIITGTRGFHARRRHERYLGRELLAIGPYASSRRSSMVGLVVVKFEASE
jgi:hypothetical protein